MPQGIEGSNPSPSAKTQNRIPAKKSHRRKPQKEDGTAFLPRPPLPCRPHFCWRFWGFPESGRKVLGAKMRWCGRGPDGYSPPFTLFFGTQIAITMFEAAHIRFYSVSGAPYAHIRTATARPTVANRNRGARPPYRYVLGANNL